MAIGHHRLVLVEVEKIAKFPWSPFLAQIQTSVGRTAVCWRGEQDARPGSYHVEWAVDDVIAWGRNAKAAAVHEPGVGPGGHCVVLRGQLCHLEEGAAALNLAGSQILLETDGHLPDDTDGTWVELFIERERVAIYPYSL